MSYSTLFALHESTEFHRDIEALDLTKPSGFVGGGLYGLREDWIAAAKAEAHRASLYRVPGDDVFRLAGIFGEYEYDADLEDAVFRHIIQ